MLNKAFHVLHLELTSQHLDIHITPSPCARLMALLATVAGCCGVLEFARLRKFKKDETWAMEGCHQEPQYPVSQHYPVYRMLQLARSSCSWSGCFFQSTHRDYSSSKWIKTVIYTGGGCGIDHFDTPSFFQNRARLCDFCPSSCAAGFLSTETFVYCVKACWS